MYEEGPELGRRGRKDSYPMQLLAAPECHTSSMCTIELRLYEGLKS